MRAINHTVTGAVIGASIGSPWLAPPLALLSHLVLDIIPHGESKDKSHTSKRFKLELLIDCALSSSFLLAIFLFQIDKWPLLIACGVLGAAPDLWWLPYWVWELEGKAKKFDKIGEFLAWIQWSSTPAGYFVEAIWLIFMMYLFLQLTI